MTFIKQLKQWPHRDDDDTIALSTSPTPTSPYLQQPNASSSSNFLGSRPRLPHMSHSSSAVNTIRKPSPSAYMTDQNNNMIDTGKGIFGVTLEESVKHASGSLKLGKKLDQDGNPIILGKIPVIVANCAHFLKTSNAKRVEGIFRVSGSARRIKELQAILTDPLQNYGKDLDWSPYTVHDAANLLRRYLNNLPEPIVPLGFYEKFRNPLLSSPCVVGHLQGGNSISATTPPTSAAISPVVKDANANELPQIAVLPPLNLDAELSSAAASATTETTDQAKPTPAQANPYQTTPQVSQIPQISVDDTDHKFDKIQYQKETDEAIVQYKQLIDQLPILNQQVLLYILDLLYFFAQNAKENLMPAVNLAAIFQPSLLSHPNHDMSPKEYHLSRAVVQFLIEHFPKLTPSIETWIKYGSKLRDSTPTPSQSQSSLEPSGSRRHSKSMSSVNIPPSIRDYISKDSATPTSKPPGGSLVESEAEQTLNSQSSPVAFTRSSPRNSPQSTEKTHSNLFKALKRGNSFSRRRTSSTSTTSSINMEQQNASDSSLTRQNTLSALSKEKNESILSEEVDEVSTTPNDAAPPHKTASSVTITPKRKPVSKGPNRVPVLTATDANGASAAAATSEPDHSEGDDAGKSSTTSHKVKRKSVSGLFTRRSNSPALSLGQLSLRNRSGSKSSVVNSNPSETLSPSLSNDMRRSIDSQSSGSPPSQSLVGLSGVHSIDSASSVGAESEDEVVNHHKGGSQLESSVSPTGEGGESRGRSSRWRRSLVALKIPIGSPDATSRSPGRSPEGKRLSFLGLSSDHGSTVSVDGSSTAGSGNGGGANPGMDGTLNPGRRILRKLNNHRRNRSAASNTSATSEGATTSGAAETSDDGLSS